LNNTNKKVIIHQKNIFIKNINIKNKLTPFKLQENSVGDFKYFPADSKE